LKTSITDDESRRRLSNNVSMNEVIKLHQVSFRRYAISSIHRLAFHSKTYVYTISYSFTREPLLNW
jgi:hypothetical protein